MKRQSDYDYSLVLPAVPELVFAAWTHPDQLRLWFTEEVELEPRVGGAYRFWGKHSLGTARREEADQCIETFEPGRRLAFTWTWSGVPSRVTIALEPDTWKPFTLGSDPARRPPQPGCKVTVQQTFEGVLPYEQPDQLVDDHWRLALGNLWAHLDGLPVLLPDYQDPTPEVRHSIHVAASPATVFRTLTEPELLERWFAAKANVDLREGGGMDLGWSGPASADPSDWPLRILELIPDRRLVLLWPDWRGRTDEPPTRVSWDLVAEDGGTRVDFAHTGFRRVVDISDYGLGWIDFLGGMQAVAQDLSSQPSRD